MDESAAELAARLTGLSEAALNRLIHQGQEAGQPQAVEIVVQELMRRGLQPGLRALRSPTESKRCKDYWHTVTGVRAARCPSCGSSSPDVWPRTRATQARQVRPRKERPERPAPDYDEDEGVLAFLWAILMDVNDDDDDDD